jgi:hypothetical protein
MRKEKEKEQEEEEGQKEMKRRRHHIAGTFVAAAALACCLVAQPAMAAPPFDPEIEASITNDQANSSTGLDIVLELPQNDDPDGIATSHLKKAIVALPPTMTVDPSVGTNLQACSPTQIGLRSNTNPTCPANSALGDVRVTTPVLDEELTGKLYLATPYANPFNNLITVYLVVGNTNRGVLIKLPGRVNLDLASGQITTVFDNNPQLPFDHLYVNLNTPNGGPLINPGCGTYAVEGTLFAWARPNTPVPLSAPFSVTGNCASAAQSDSLALSSTTALNRAVKKFRKANKKRKKQRAKRAKLARR